MKLSLSLGLCGASALSLGGSGAAQFNLTAASYFAGQQPDATAIADLDGDGDLDIAAATDAPDKISILFNAGNGTFGAPVNVFLGGGTSPHTPVAGDLDGDGDVDLAVSLTNVNAVQVIANNGGAFAPGASFPVGAEPRDMEIADLDNDGDLDLVVSNRSGNSVSVLRNGGGFAFSVASFAAGLDPREIDVGDVTGDGLADIAVAAHDSDQVVVLRNTGAASFVSHASLSTSPRSPEGVVIARLDGNATLDIAASAGNNNQEFAIVFSNAGGGSFGVGAAFFQPGQDGGSIVAADMDVDGDMDLAIANQGTNDVAALPNFGAGTFGAAQTFGVGSAPTHIDSADLDGNGGADLVTANDGSSNVTVLSNGLGSACSATTYCVGKVNSAGTVAQMGSTGTPSVDAQDFMITIVNALPNQNGLLFFSRIGPAATPFQGGTLCAQPPLIRAGIQQLSPAGATAYSVAVTPDLVGTTRWYQFYYRDPSHPDGTAVALSNALEVRFCN